MTAVWNELCGFINIIANILIIPIGCLFIFGFFYFVLVFPLVVMFKAWEWIKK